MEQLMSLSKIFSEKIFRIPDYQRGYSWTKKEVEEFWSDLCRLESRKNHYVGVLTLEPVKEDEYKTWVDDTWIIESKRYVPYYVVDGQQRLTTSIILIHTILEIMKQKEIDKLNYTTQDEISKKFICESKNENKSLTYIFGYEYNNPSYEYLISQVFKENIHCRCNIEETTYTMNLKNAKEIFYNKLTILSFEELENVYTKITQHFLYNMYIISEDIDVHVTFETMNNRGKPLSHLELLKNRLIYISTLFDASDSDKIRLRRNINNCWKGIYHLLGKNKEERLQDDEFLVTHFMLYFCKKINDMEKRERYLYNRVFGEWQNNYLLNSYFVPLNIIEKKLTMTECFNYIESLNDCIVQWGYIKNPISSSLTDEVKEYVEKIKFLSIPSRRYYRNKFQVEANYINVFVLACFQACKNNDDVLLKYLKALEKYIFAIEFFDSEAIDELNINLISFRETVVKLNTGDISINEVIDKLNKIYLQLTNTPEIAKRTIQYYNRVGFYGCNWLRYFLCEYELKLMKMSKSNISKLNKEILFDNGYNSIEHIYPENSHYKYWTNLYSKFSTKQRNSLKRSLGNFVAISGTKNSKIGNIPFPEKKCNSQNSLGYKYGTYAEIELTQYNDWGAEEILSRGLKLVSFLQERWGIKVGSGKKEDKKLFLGLDFLK